MRVPKMPNDELSRLFLAVHEGTCSPDEPARLEQLIHDSPEAREQYVRFVAMCSMLRFGHVLPHRAGSSAATLESAPESIVPLQTAPAFAPVTLSSSLQNFFSAGWPVAYLVAVVVVGFGIAIAAITYVSNPTQLAQTPRQTGEGRRHRESEAAVVGRVSWMADCRWMDEKVQGPRFKVQDPIILGQRFALHSGLVEITYNSGAKVVLQGPVAYHVDSSAGGYLAAGKLTARVEKRTGTVASGQWPEQGREERGEGRGKSGAKQSNRVQPQSALAPALSQREGPSETNPQSLIPNPSSSHSPLATRHSSRPSPLSPLPSPLFTISTPTAVVSDLGTEFGVDVDPQGNTQSHVFQGVIEVRPLANNPAEATPVRLNQNESIQIRRVDGQQSLQISHEAVDAATFVRVEQLPKLAAHASQQPFRSWQAFSRQLRRDPSLLGYYDFQKRNGSPNMLFNVARNGTPSFDGVIEDATWTSGRMPGKNALQFNCRDNYVRFCLPQKVANLTMAAWVCVESLDNPWSSGLIMSRDFGSPGDIHWQIRSNGAVRLDVFGWKQSYESSPVFDRTRLNRWTHLAITTAQNAGKTEVKLYVNGRLADEATLAENIPLRIGPAAFGHWFPWATRNTTPRYLHGRIDEIAIFGRALSPSEIAELHRSGSDTPPPGNGEMQTTKGG